MGQSRKKRRASVGVLFWVAIILLVAVIFLANRTNIERVLNSTGLVEVIQDELGIGGDDGPVVQQGEDTGEQNNEAQDSGTGSGASGGSAGGSGGSGGGSGSDGSGASGGSGTGGAGSGSTSSSGGSDGASGSDGGLPGGASEETSPGGGSQSGGSGSSATGSSGAGSSGSGSDTIVVAPDTDGRSGGAGSGRSSRDGETGSTSQSDGGSKDESTSGGERVSALPQERQGGPVRERDAAIYFIRVTDDGAIHPEQVRRTVEYVDTPMTATLRTLLEGPTAQELSLGLLNLIPDGTKLISARVENGVAYLNFNEAFRFNSMGAEGLIAQLQQIVFSSTEFRTVNKVQILVEGQRVEYLGEGIYTGEPIGREQFS